MSKFNIKKSESFVEKTDEYQYRTTSKKVGRNKDVVTFTVDPILADKIERMAYHNHTTVSEIANTIFNEALKDKNFPPIPSKKPIKV